MVCKEGTSRASGPKSAASYKNSGACAEELHCLSCRRESHLLSRVGDRRLYFVHSFRATPTPQNEEWALSTTSYGRDFVSVVEKGNISATQFHPEKSGGAGLDVLKSFLEAGAPPNAAYRSPNSNG